MIGDGVFREEWILPGENRPRSFLIFGRYFSRNYLKKVLAFS